MAGVRGVMGGGRVCDGEREAVRPRGRTGRLVFQEGSLVSRDGGIKVHVRIERYGPGQMFLCR